MRVNAVNHLGWCVEEFKDSWVAITDPMSREVAEDHCKKLKDRHSNTEFRVYEAVQ